MSTLYMPFFESYRSKSSCIYEFLAARYEGMRVWEHLGLAALMRCAPPPVGWGAPLLPLSSPRHLLLLYAPVCPSPALLAISHPFPLSLCHFSSHVRNSSSLPTSFPSFSLLSLLPSFVLPFPVFSPPSPPPLYNVHVFCNRQIHQNMCLFQKVFTYLSIQLILYILL